MVLGPGRLRALCGILDPQSILLPILSALGLGGRLNRCKKAAAWKTVGRRPFRYLGRDRPGKPDTERLGLYGIFDYR